jgi:hypothetical protein
LVSCFFSTERLSTIWPPRLARDGDPEPIHIEDSDTTFAIE